MAFRHFNPRLLALLLLTALTSAISAATAAPTSAPAPVLRKIAFDQYRLPNGLRVLLAPDHSVPVAAVCVTYDVGARNEVPGRAGFAHLFEHLMFEGSAHVRSGQHVRLIRWAGGAANGGTNSDVTHYYENFPREQLKLALFLEADRMFSLRLDQETFVKARSIVEAEKRERHDSSAYDPVAVTLQRLAFKKFANTHTAIGTVDDLQSATLEDARRFYAAYYTPQNAALAVSGDFDPVQVKAMIAAYFSKNKSFAALPPAVDDTERPDAPISSQMPWTHLTLTRNALPRYYLAFRIPPQNQADYPALVMLSDILGDGRGSRCSQALVEKGIATDEKVTCYGGRGPDLFQFSAQATDRHGDLMDIRHSFAGEIRRVCQQGVTAKELARVRNEERVTAITDQATALSRSRLLADNAIAYKDPARINTLPAAFQAVTAADILRVARKYLNSSNGVELFAR